MPPSPEHDPEDGAVEAVQREDGREHEAPGCALADGGPNEHPKALRASERARSVTARRRARARDLGRALADGDEHPQALLEREKGIRSIGVAPGRVPSPD